MPISPFTLVRCGAVGLADGINPDLFLKAAARLSEVIIAAQSLVLGGEQVPGGEGGIRTPRYSYPYNLFRVLRFA